MRLLLGVNSILGRMISPVSLSWSITPRNSSPTSVSPSSVVSLYLTSDFAGAVQMKLQLELYYRKVLVRKTLVNILFSSIWYKSLVNEYISQKIKSIVTIITIVTIVTTVTINCNYCKYWMVLIGQIMDDSPNSTNFPSPKHSHYTAFQPKIIKT